MGVDEAAEEDEEEEEEECDEADGDSGPFGAWSVFECDPGMDALAVGPMANKRDEANKRGHTNLRVEQNMVKTERQTCACLGE